MYADYEHASIRTQREMYVPRAKPKPDAFVIWLPGSGGAAGLPPAGAPLPWLKWSLAAEAGSMLRLTPPQRFIRVEGSACVEPPDLASAVSAVHAMLRQAESMGLDSNRILVGGFGQGGTLALAAARSYPKPLAGIAVFSGWVAGMCIANAANAATPILMCHGTDDATASHHLLHESVALLRGQHDASVTAHSIPGLGHSHSPEGSKLLRDFLFETLASRDNEASSAAAAEAPPPEAPALSKSVIKMRGRTPASGSDPKAAGGCAAAFTDTTESTDGVTLSRQRVAEDPTQEDLVVVVDLPDVESMGDLELAISPGRIELLVPGRASPVLVDIDAAWDTETARAKFSKKRHELTVRLAARTAESIG